ncbi:glycosyltransferase family 2 protein [Tilletiaria anomala UBC 951]|uniref:Chitin synthase n=1 Tax=Tilletiaria anomala (strain ATCC 24038 / CBS 436.72 / UBC 951) TaxID=1037660 RepID=A0A066WH45_TILAU|nr:glycosyltransferase family 2 protein [Tilletiaria anomala UBC 951]KDN53317.1 glycosyltransferase family 2 protein [Tilletiaria anomala UBC 951]
MLGTPGALIATAAAPSSAFGSGRPLADYGATRERLLRKRTVRHIELTNGNLVLEVPVPASISKSGQGAEFSRMRYMAVTCDPNDFVRERYALRPWLYGRAPVELMICMTMYNEDATLFTRTMSGVIKNIAHLCSRTRSKTWGQDAWKKIVVVVVSDGRKKANADTLKVLGLYGCYNEAVMLDHVSDKPTTAHVFEYTTQVVVGPDGTVTVGACPIQLIFCLKEKNQKKLNSHRWFFNAFALQLQPNVCILLDVGTKPSGTSLYELWKAFDRHPSCGGACGEIRVDAGKGQWQLLNPLVASQNFEYKVSNILDKPLESVFGYISVLPGAFSAYRYKAVLGAPLESYFKGEALHSGAAGVHAGTFESNMYLAEDRILCFELVTKRQQAWTLRYIKSAHASTDVPAQVPEFIAQRRRWLNGSLFASIYAVLHWYRIWSSGQGFLRKLALMLQAIYNLISLVFSYTAPANFFLAFFFLVSSATSDPTQDPFGGQGAAVLEAVENIFIALMVVCLVCSLGNRPQGSKLAYTGVMILFACIMGLTLYCAGFTTYLALNAAGLTNLRNWTLANIEQLFLTSGFRDIVISLCSTYILWLVASILFLDPWHMFTSFLQYMLLIPSYTIILAIYSMSNLHDVSWGTKGSDQAHTDLGQATTQKKDGKEVVQVKVPTTQGEAEELWSSMQRDLATPKPEVHQKRSADQKQQDHYANFRTNFLLAWIVTNAALILIFTSSWFNAYIRRKHKESGNRGPVINPYQTVVFYSMAAFAAVRAFGSLLYMLMWIFRL